MSSSVPPKIGCTKVDRTSSSERTFVDNETVLSIASAAEPIPFDSVATAFCSSSAIAAVVSASAAALLAASSAERSESRDVSLIWFAVTHAITPATTTSAIAVRMIHVLPKDRIPPLWLNCAVNMGARRDAN